MLAPLPSRLEREQRRSVLDDGASSCQRVSTIPGLVVVVPYDARCGIQHDEMIKSVELSVVGDDDGEGRCQHSMMMTMQHM